MSEQQTLVDRMKFLRHQVFHLNQRDFAAQLGTSHASIAQIETGRMGISSRLMQTLVDRLNVNPDWITDGSEPMFQTLRTTFRGRSVDIAPPDYTRPGHGDLTFRKHEYVFVRRMDLSVSAGSGVVPVEGNEDDALALPTAWFSRAHVNADLTVMVKVQGDSMAPGIPDGSFVLLHLIEKLVLKSGVYAFTREGQSYVKRLVPSDVSSDGRPKTIMIIADNVAFPPQVVTREDLNALRIVGRVIAVLSMLD